MIQFTQKVAVVVKIKTTVDSKLNDSSDKLMILSLSIIVQPNLVEAKLKFLLLFR